jgi:hypothetical protein
MELESRFQSRLIKKLRSMFPGAIILKNDPNYLQSFPDLTILYRDKWAVLETKRSEDASRRPNQGYYIRLANEMSYGSFICPENEERVLNELQQALRPSRNARFFKS